MRRDRPPIEHVFAELVRTRTEEQLAVWLRRGLLEADFAPIALSHEPSPEAQIQDLFETLPSELQERFREALCLVLSSWSPGAHGRRMLESLAVLAAYIREPLVVDYVRKVIVEGWLDSFDEEGRFETLQTLVAVVGGFAPHPKVQSLFETLFAPPGLDERLAAQLFIGLCRCDVERYPQYVPRLVRILVSRPDYFRLDYLFAEFVNVVGLATIARRFMDIDPEYRDEFRQFLFALPSSPARLRLTDQGLCIAPNPHFEALGPEYRTDPSVYPLYPRPDTEVRVTDDTTDLFTGEETLRAVREQMDTLESYPGGLVPYFEYVFN